MEFDEGFSKDDIRFFIIPNGGGNDLTVNTHTAILNEGLTNGTRVVFDENADAAFLPDADGKPDVQLHGQNGWNIRFDTDSGYMLEGEVDEQPGNQHWEDLPKDFDSGKWYDLDDVRVTVEWSTKRIVYGTDENETLFGSDGPDLFYWSSSAFGGVDTIENFDSSNDKLVFAGLLDGDNNALDTLLNSGTRTDSTFTATYGVTSISLNIASDAATLQLSADGNTQTIEIHGGIQPFVDSLSDDATAVAFLQQIISVGG